MNTTQKDFEIDFFLVKGIVEDLLTYMGYQNRYSFRKSNCGDLHPGVQAYIILDGKEIGILGKVHPNLTKKEIFVFECNLDSLYGKTNRLKYKEAFKYPSVEKKSIAFKLVFNGMDHTLTDEEVMNTFNQIIDKVVSTHKAELRDK